MTTPTNKQIEFATNMNTRQWDVLRSITGVPYFLSASERADPELYALIRNGLASCHSSLPNGPSLLNWTATEAGTTLVKRYERDGAKKLAPQRSAVRQ
jgi:hypothetical protein